ncbi:class I SAM-dependent methyltransferase [Desulforamulus ruminis]|uniref:class I SAM-dependent methyltransferase n=1 Tax=Desulforamulus ruminis TaxID=1564 RepID=UPI002FD908E9
MQQKLGGVPETMLIPLWAKAVEAQRDDPIVKDEYALKMMRAIDYDFSKFERARMSQVGVMVRTELLDKAAQAFIHRHPDAVIINIGCGLDTRFFRLDNGRIRWYELDLPEAMEIRKRFFEETDRYKMIAKSVFDFTWPDDIERTNEGVLIIAEGILMYFTEQEVQNLLNKLVEAFPRGEMLMEILSPLLVNRSKHHDAVKKMNAQFLWGVKDGRQVEKFNPRIRLHDEWNYFDYHKRRWRWLGWLATIPAFKRNFNNKIIHLHFVK